MTNIRKDKFLIKYHKNIKQAHKKCIIITNDFRGSTRENCMLITMSSTYN